MRKLAWHQYAGQSNVQTQCVRHIGSVKGCSHSRKRAYCAAGSSVILAIAMRLDVQNKEQMM
jgi:hypothetical protein